MAASNEAIIILWWHRKCGCASSVRRNVRFKTKWISRYWHIKWASLNNLRLTDSVEIQYFQRSGERYNKILWLVGSEWDLPISSCRNIKHKMPFHSRRQHLKYYIVLLSNAFDLLEVLKLQATSNFSFISFRLPEFIPNPPPPFLVMVGIRNL